VQACNFSYLSVRYKKLGVAMTNQETLLKKIPDRISDSEVLKLLHTVNINWMYIKLFKEYAALKDEIISEWLNINVRTLRNYKKPENKFKDNIKEQLILLLSLFKHGYEVFGDADEFRKWLNSENFYFDKKAPVSYLNTVTGIRFVDDRLTALEHGDNV
jgi:putative toxin-antitoxin system antitoxin component (TIGR02293 family)